MRLVLDTDVIVAAVRSATGASRALLNAVAATKAAALVSVPLFIEYEAVLRRPLLKEETGLETAEAEEILDGLANIMTTVEIHYLWRPLLSDPFDDMVLETAVNGGAQAIVTFTARDFRDVPGTFGISVLAPSAALRDVRST
ncbi:MAG: putative toxin-antitoxin system toxin component, PIN family [Alphaproteobacteria bacterium]|nr:putative toxin-antitoxin system toxin component, PIN family [Alphaproteobacteria bacterium]